MTDSLSTLSAEDRVRLLALLEIRAAAVAWRCDVPDCDGRPHEGRDYLHARWKQRPPWGLLDPTGQPYRRWYLRGGRGTGKTWAGANALAEVILWYGGYDDMGAPRSYGVVGPSYKYAKETLIEGDSGLLLALGGENGPNIRAYNRSTGTVYLANGAIVYTGGADNRAEGIEGKNISAVWLDEVGLWSLRRWQYVWENVLPFAVRKDPSLFIITGTPKEGHPFVKKLTEDPAVYGMVMATRENHTLPANVLAEYERKYAGTRLGRQELEGELLVDTIGALWNSAIVEELRLGVPGKPGGPYPEDYRRIVVGWDPAVTSGTDSDEHGIIVAAIKDGDPSHFYVLEDCSGVYSPMGAVRVVQEAYDKWAADSVIAETNNGGDMIGALLRTAAPIINLKTVTATRGKRTRAEPIAALSEQGRLHLVGVFPELENQMTSWTPQSSLSPDRLDAMVWAVTALSESKTAPGNFWGQSRSK